METAGEERVRATHSLKQLEDAAILLDRNAHASAQPELAEDVPQKLSTVLHSMTVISSRDDAERLLAAGVSLWNSAILLEGKDAGSKNVEALVKVRHVAADCIYMSITALGGVSARFDIDEVSLLKFYTAVGRKYAADVGDLDMANICFSKAFEFGKNAEAVARNERSGPSGIRAFSKAMFDLLLGGAECRWERGAAEEAEAMVANARSYLADLPSEIGYLASVEFNIGLHAYQNKEIDKALRWLRQSLKTRSSRENPEMDRIKQAKTARLVGVCLIAQQKYIEAKKYLEEAQELHSDPSGAYLLLKVVLLTKMGTPLPILMKNLNDPKTDVEICVANVTLLTDAGNVSDAVSGYEFLFKKFADDSVAILRHIGPRFVEALCSVGNVHRALQVITTCQEMIDKCVTESDDEKAKLRSRFANISLNAGAALADRKCYQFAALILDRMIEQLRTKGCHPEDNVMSENEASICRLASSCALCAAEDMQDRESLVPANTQKMKSGDKDDQGVSESLPIADTTFEKVSQELLDIAFKHAVRACEIDSDDFAARLLIFRIHLARKDAEKAARVLELANEELPDFDVGALAAAACSAKSANAPDAVLAALGCILKATSSLQEASSTTSPGFYGNVLCAATEIVLDRDALQHSARSDTASKVHNMSIDHESENEPFIHNFESRKALYRILKSGLSGISKLGPEVAFGQDKRHKESVLTFLTDVSWNAGRDAALTSIHEECSDLFDLTYDFCQLRERSVDVIQTQKVARFISANSIVESATRTERLQHGQARLRDVRRLVEEVKKLSQGSGKKDDAILPLVATLEARCLSKVGDSLKLHALAADASSASYRSPVLMEQLASICYYADPVDPTHLEQPVFRNNVLETCVLCLTSAVQERLSSSVIDLRAVAALCREIIKIELSRRAEKAYPMAEQVVGIFQEHCNGSESFPADEARWLTAITWETAQMFYRTGKHEEAKRWIQLACSAAKCDVALASYLPRIQKFADEIAA